MINVQSTSIPAPLGGHGGGVENISPTHSFVSCRSLTSSQNFQTKNGVNQNLNMSNNEEPTNGFATLSSQAIAVVGMGMRLPGGVRTAEQFWDALIEKKDCSSEIPRNRYNVDGFYSADKPGAVKTRRGYFLEDDYIGNADLNFFPAIPGFEMDELDPQQTLLMEVIWECMENAGQTGWNGKDIGCYVGVFGEDWHELTAKETLSTPRVHAFANGGFTLSNRVSYQFDLKGPRLVPIVRDGGYATLLLLSNLK